MTFRREVETGPQIPSSLEELQQMVWGELEAGSSYGCGVSEKAIRRWEDKRGKNLELGSDALANLFPSRCHSRVTKLFNALLRRGIRTIGDLHERRGETIKGVDRTDQLRLGLRAIRQPTANRRVVNLMIGFIKANWDSEEGWRQGV